MKLLKEIGDWLYTMIISCTLALCITVFLFQPTTVLGQSMEPTLRDGQYVFLSKISHTLGRLPAYGDIVVLDSRVERERDLKDDLTDPVTNIMRMLQGKLPGHNIWVKRVIGLPGDEIEFKDGKTYRNGMLLHEPYTKEPVNHNAERRFIIPANHVFVLGDNRNNSSDSRFIGSIPARNILGVMMFKL